jgi:hypothetical protein
MKKTIQFSQLFIIGIGLNVCTSDQSDGSVGVANSDLS